MPLLVENGLRIVNSVPNLSLSYNLTVKKIFLN